MRMLVTGGAGFIGSHLTSLLLSQGHDVTVLDDLSTGLSANLGGHGSNPRLTVRVGSVTDASLVDALVAASERVFHLAAVVGVRLALQESLRSIQTNVHGTSVVLEAAARRRIPTFLASSSEVYGAAFLAPHREDDVLALGPTSNARWAYACSKMMDECLAFAFHREQGLPVVVGRMFNTAGPGQLGRYGMVIPNLVHQALQGQAMTVHGDGAQTRCFCHVRDTARAIAGLLDNPACHGQVFNIGSTREVSIAELARMVQDITCSTSPIETVPYQAAYGVQFEDMRRRVPDTSKIQAHIGWQPEITLEQLIEDVVAAVRSGAAR
jgi:UDP-glucose 4-epimerase